MRIYKPYLRATLDIGFLKLHTEVWSEAFDRDVFNYIRLCWSFFKWSGDFNLYRPGYDIRAKKPRKKSAHRQRLLKYFKSSKQTPNKPSEDSK